MKFNATITLAILAVLTVVGAGYMSVGVLGAGPAQQVTRVTLLLNTSGGLLPTSAVTMRGIKVGRVTGIRTSPQGLAVSMDLDSAHPIPANSAITVENLSVAGEQYVNFTPDRIEPPYLTDDALIPADRVTPTVTVSDLLARGNALLSAINPDDVATAVSNISQMLEGNERTLDSLATTAGLFANMMQENRQLVATLFGNLSTLTTGMGELGVGEVFSETGHLLPQAIPAFIRLIGEFDALSRTGEQAFAPDKSAATLLAKLSEYIDRLSVPLGTFATVLQPVTAPLRGYKVDAGHWLDFWESTFSDNGGLRVRLDVTG